MTGAEDSGTEMGERRDREEGHGQDVEGDGGNADLEIYGDPNDDPSETTNEDGTPRQEGNVHAGGDGGKERNVDAAGDAGKDTPEEPLNDQ